MSTFEELNSNVVTKYDRNQFAPKNLVEAGIRTKQLVKGSSLDKKKKINKNQYHKRMCLMPNSCKKNGKK